MINYIIKCLCVRLYVQHFTCIDMILFIFSLFGFMCVCFIILIAFLRARYQLFLPISHIRQQKREEVK